MRDLPRIGVAKVSPVTVNALMNHTIEQLEGNVVKLTVAVPADEFETAIDAAFRKLSFEVKIDGFRPGKAPRRILEARFGPEVGREQALKDGLPEYYADAVVASDLDTIAPPQIEITAGEETGDLEFNAVVEVRPVVHVTGYDTLRVELDYAPVDVAAVDAQIEALRERFVDLEASDEPLVDGDYAEIDITGSVDGEPVDTLTASDYLYEVGSETVTPSLDETLRGEKPGAILEFTDTLPESFGEQAGTVVSFKLMVKDAKHKVLPELTDTWVSDVTEFESVDALRQDAEMRLSVVRKLQAQMALRDRVLEELAGLVPVEPPEPLIGQEMDRRLRDLMQRLEADGISIPQYLMATGQEQEAFLEGLRSGAANAVLADLGLRAVVDQEAIEASDDELEAEIDRLAQRLGDKPAKVRRDLDRRGVLGAVRSDIARGKALEFLVDNANVVDSEGNALDLTLPERSPISDDEPQVIANDEPIQSEEESQE